MEAKRFVGGALKAVLSLGFILALIGCGDGLYPAFGSKKPSKGGNGSSTTTQSGQTSSTGGGSTGGGSTGGGSTGGGSTDGGGSTGGGTGASTTGGTGGTAGTFTKNVTINGVDRNYILYVPSSVMTAQQTGPVPMVYALHGAGDTADNFMAATDLTTAASTNKFILAAPNAYPGTGGTQGWFLDQNQGWPAADGNSNSINNDILLILKIKEDTGALYNLNLKKIYCCGFSRGAGFTGLLATCSNNAGVFSGSYSSPFAAYGISAGYDALGGQVNFANSSPKRPVWLIHGTNDQAVPYSMGQDFANALTAAGWSATFTTVNGAPHAWLWRPQYGHSNQELIDYFYANPLP